MKQSAILILSLNLCLFGCAIRRGGASANMRGERLAIERGKLSETTDPVAQTKSYIVISDILLSFATDAARDQDHEDFRKLIVEYSRTITMARDGLINSERKPDRQPQPYSNLEEALTRQLRTLQNLKGTLTPDDQEALGQVIQTASTIHQEISNMLSRSRAGN